MAAVALFALVILFIAYPKGTALGLLAAVGLALAGVVFLLIWLFAPTSPQDRKALDQISFKARYDDSACSVEWPILVTVVNRSARTILKHETTVLAWIEGRSGISIQFKIDDDKIVAPGETYASCWSVRGYHTVAASELRSLKWDTGRSIVSLKKRDDLSRR